MNTQEPSWGGLTWTDWIPLFSDRSVFRTVITTLPGYYRVRSQAVSGLVYVGQTGRDLRERTRALAIHANRDLSQPPWNDPHTAAPALWAYHHEDGLEFELSVAATDLGYEARQCFEDYLLYLHRLEHGHSTLANHGRFHPGWDRPSSKAGKRAMKRTAIPTAYDSMPPIDRTTDFASVSWLGLQWSEPQPLLEAAIPSCPGIYRIYQDEEPLYCGESQRLAGRLAGHKKRDCFSRATVSYHEMDGALPHHLKEREVDMIGWCVEVLGSGPWFQYQNFR